MRLTTQRRIAAQVLKVGQSRVLFDNDRLQDVKEAITKADVRSLIAKKVIKKIPEKKNSRGRKRKSLQQKRKGRKKGAGSRKGRKTSRLPRKRMWMQKVRVQRELLRKLKEKGMIAREDFKELYTKVKGGFFRNKRHIKIYIEEKGLIKKKENDAEKKKAGKN